MATTLYGGRSRSKAIVIAGILTGCCLLPGLTYGAAAEEEPDAFETPTQTVEVSGQASTVLLSYKQIIAGIDAFERGTALAPSATLTFRLFRLQSATKTRGVRLALVGDNLQRPLAISRTGQVTIPRDPAALAASANLVVNRTTHALMIEPSVDSAGLPPGASRLGDLRLKCQVMAAMRGAKMSFLDRALARTRGSGCDQLTVTKTVGARTTFTGYTMRDGERVGSSDPARVSAAGDQIDIPLKDMSWSDDTLIYLKSVPNQPATPATSPPA
jgi:hypothetical protein